MSGDSTAVHSSAHRLGGHCGLGWALNHPTGSSSQPCDIGAVIILCIFLVFKNLLKIITLLPKNIDNTHSKIKLYQKYMQYMLHIYAPHPLVPLPGGSLCFL